MTWNHIDTQAAHTVKAKKVSVWPNTEGKENPIQRVVHKNRLAASTNLVLHHLAELIIFILTTNTVLIMHDDQYCPYHPPLIFHQHHAAIK